MAKRKPYNAGDEVSTEEGKKAARLAARQSQKELQAVLSTVEGRAVFWWLLGLCGVYSSSYRGDPHEMIYHEGQRKIGLTLIDHLNHAAPNAYVLMQAEALARANQKKAIEEDA